jgi:large subunit ribosomal protein L31e
MDKKTGERVYSIPLRREWVRQPRVKRAPAGVAAVRKFLEKHTKSEVKLSSGLNELLWAGGIKSPPGRIKVAVELKDGIAFARLPQEKPVQERAKKDSRKEPAGGAEKEKQSVENGKEKTAEKVTGDKEMGGGGFPDAQKAKKTKKT